MDGFEYTLNADQIWLVVETIMILIFLEQIVSNSRKLKIITISTTAYISSVFNLYSDPSTYLKTLSSDLSFTEFSPPLAEDNLSKKNVVVVYETNYIISIECLNDRIHTQQLRSF